MYGCAMVVAESRGTGGTPGLKEYKKSWERQTAGVGGVSSSVMSNTLQPVQLSGVELDDTVMQVNSIGGWS